MTYLATGFSVKDYKDALKTQDKNKISEGIRRRFIERYIAPSSVPREKHGFTMMAVSCLMLEAFVTLKQGWETSKGKSEEAFRIFFNDSKRFGDFKNHEKDFYVNVRCGILHQAETTGGWKIRRQGPIFDAKTKTINATTFIKNLEKDLNDFCSNLNSLPWDSLDWEKVRKKMNKTCESCG